MSYASLLETILYRRGGGGGSFRGWGGGVRGSASHANGPHSNIVLGRPATLAGQEMARDQRTEFERNGENPIYEEKWSKIYPGQLVVRRFFLPSAVCKRIDTKQIKGVYFRKQDYPSTMDDVRIWGMAFFCGWAFDMMRGFRKNAGERGFYNVAVDVEGDEKMTGFTTANLPVLLTALHYQCKKDVVMQEGFPWCSEHSASEGYESSQGY